MESPRIGGEERRPFPLPALGFLFAINVMEKVASYTISTSMITYLMNIQFHGVKQAAVITNIWGGATAMIVALGCGVNHYFQGRRFTVVMVSSLIYIMALIALTMDEFIPVLKPCQSACHVQKKAHTVIFFCFIAILSVASGVLRAYLESLISAQSDDHHDQKWWEIVLATLNLMVSVGIGYAMHYWDWGLTNGLLAVVLASAVGFFCYGRRAYRVRMPTQISSVTQGANLCMLILLWVTCIVFGLYKAQTSTFFVVQSGSMDRRIGHTEIPPAVIVCVSTFGGELLIRLLEKLTRREEGISVLVRAQIGLFLTVIGMLIGAIVERKRLNQVMQTEGGSYGPIKMSAFSLLPQGMLFSIADTLVSRGVTEHFKEQVPSSSSSLAKAFYMSAIGVGSFISDAFLVAIDHNTSWFGGDVDHSHIDKFYWLLFSTILLYLIVFLIFSYQQILHRA